jgi:hypothetical protein
MSPEKQARYASGAQLSWLEAELAFCLVTLGSITVALFFTAGPVGKALIIIAGLLAVAVIVRFVVERVREGLMIAAQNSRRTSKTPSYQRTRDAKLSKSFVSGNSLGPC